VIFASGFNVPGFDWNCGLLSPNCPFYKRQKGGVINSATCFLGLNQHNYPDKDRNLLHLFFSSNFADLSVDHAQYGLVKPDDFRPPFSIDGIDCAMPIRRYKQNLTIP
jgi:hypothetical protein